MIVEGRIYFVTLIVFMSILSLSFCCKPSLVEVAIKPVKHENKVTFQYCPPYSRKDAGTFEFSIPPPKSSFKPKGTSYLDTYFRIV